MDPIFQKSKSIWKILIKTNEVQYENKINFINLFKELKNLGNYYVEKVDSLSDCESETWSITLITGVSDKIIKTVLHIIEDDCTIIKLAEGIEYFEDINNLFNSKLKQEEISIMDAIKNVIKKQSKF